MKWHLAFGKDRRRINSSRWYWGAAISQSNTEVSLQKVLHDVALTTWWVYKWGLILWSTYMESNTNKLLKLLKLPPFLWLSGVSSGLSHPCHCNFTTTFMELVKLLRCKVLTGVATEEPWPYWSQQEMLLTSESTAFHCLSRQMHCWEVTHHLGLPRVYLKLQWLWGGKKSVLELLMYPGRSKFPLGMRWLNCHFKFYILPLNQLFHLNKKILFSGMEMQLLQVTLQHADLLLTIYSFKEKIP